MDIDGDGITDFKFENNMAVYSSYGPGVFKVYLNLNLYTNEFVFMNFLVAALDNGQVVSNALYFGSGYNGLIGIYSAPTFVAPFGWGYFSGANTDKFIGVKFDISGNTHYGWIRLRGVTENLDQWMIVDAGWEDTPDTPITIDAPLNNLSIKENNSFEFSVTNNNNVLEINSEFRNSELTIYDVNGKLVLSKTLLSNHEQIPYHFPKGLYIVRLTSKGRLATKKIYLD